MKKWKALSMLYNRHIAQKIGSKPDGKPFQCYLTPHKNHRKPFRSYDPHYETMGDHFIVTANLYLRNLESHFDIAAL